MKADLHLHSKYSKKPTEWFLKKLGAAESYTEPEKIYERLKSKGFDLVTITDHNSIKGCLKLKERHQNDTFISVESTAHFPEDDCKVHVLIYGINEEIFLEIQKLRYNIYDLATYLKSNSIPCSVAHPLYSVNNKLTIDHFEKLILLFDNFEIVNGGRGKVHNETFSKFLNNLDENVFTDIANRHDITPLATYKKGMTAGSDDHAGLFMGKAYTVCNDAYDTQTFLNCIRENRCTGYGNSAVFYSLAFHIYKIAYDFSNKNKTFSFFEGVLENIVKLISSKNKLTLFDKLKLNRLKKKSNIHNLLTDLIYNLSEMDEDEIEKKIDLVYKKASDISDEFVKGILKKFKKKKITLDGIYYAINSLLPAAFLTIPFISSFSQMYKDSEVIREVSNKYLDDGSQKVKRIAWFTDTIDDLNGVSVTLKTLGKKTSKKDLPIRIFGSLETENLSKRLPDNFLNTPPVISFPLPYYSKQQIRIPSILKLIKEVYNFEPDEIYISTPGPLGMAGFFIGKMLKIKIVGVYHTDFAKEAFQISKDASLCSLIDKYVNYFYNQMDEVKATSLEYTSLLSNRGIDKKKLSVFKRGIDLDIFKPNISPVIDNNIFNLLYVGRISKDKNIEFLLEVYEEVSRHLEKRDKHVKLYLVGDGPLKKKLEKRNRNKNIIFTGQLNYEHLTEYYNLADLFLFPSNTDTFGMVVLEAQACGVPAVVSDIGGPKEIVVNGQTGFVAKADNLTDWADKIITFLENRSDLENYLRFKREAVKNITNNYSWDYALSDIFNKNRAIV